MNPKLNKLNKLIAIILFLFPFTLLFSQSNTQYIKIPDASFEKALIEQGIDSDGQVNGLVKRDDIILIEELNLSGKDIVDLSGIEAFMSLKKLNISNNSIERLYLENLYFLESLNCSDNPLKYLRISKFANIQHFTYDTVRKDEYDFAVVKL